ncbi:MAG: GNAT family N-acetyltransferase [Planctomycetes bacterium]|nr:GNAT family N-acetyltransferase [Planctomycetota bacterium]
MTTVAADVQQLDRAAVQRWLPQLDRWLLDGHFYGVQHTWPQLYRSDGEGRFFVRLDGERLVSHCACRLVTLHGANGPQRACLLGSVATDPARRGRGHAGDVLAAALAATAPLVDLTLLWAERPELYARHGFVPGALETCLVLARRPRPDLTGVRQAEPRDHGALHALHEQKPWRVERSLHTMSGLLTTPGMTTAVLEDGGHVVAYACCGKGADLQGHWHELGGSDEALARLLPAALHVADLVESFLLLPPYRHELRERLGAAVTGAFQVPGPMLRSVDGDRAALWVDGLDSV